MSSRVSWDLIESLQAALETGSLSAAARALGVTQPTIRRHLDELEATLGVALFTRSPAGLVPTDAAIAIAPHARDIRALMAALVRSASADAGRVSGTIRLSCSEIMGNEVLPTLLAPFLAAHRDLTVELVASNRTDDVLRRDADIAVRMVRPTQGGLVGRKVAAVPIGLFAARSYLAHAGEPKDLSDLIANHAMVGEDQGTAIRDALHQLSPNTRAINFRLRSDSDSVQLAAVRAGIGIGVCQVPLGEADGRLRRILPQIETELGIWLVTHEDLRDQRRIRALLDHLGGALIDYANGLRA